MTNTEQQSSDDTDKVWNHRGAVVFSPIFDWPPRPVAALLTLTKRWVTITRNVLFLLMAISVYQLFVPDLQQMKSLSLQWVLPIYIRNIMLMIVVAGSLHLFFFTFRKQGKTLKFDARESFEKSKKFAFKNQLHDNMFWSLASGVTVWTAYEVMYLWGAANGVIPTLDFASHPTAFFIWLIVLPIVTSSHFYFVHRLLHWPPLFKRVHRLHHLNVHIGPWSGMSMHPVEHIIYISSVLIHFVIASHPVILLLHLYIRCLGPAFSHSGFEKLLTKDKALTDAADFHHQLHHRFFECNYGTVDIPWDRLFGSDHNGSDEDTVRTQQRRREMYKSKRPQVAKS